MVSICFHVDLTARILISFLDILRALKTEFMLVVLRVSVCADYE